LRIGSPLPTQHRAESIIAVFGEQMATQTQVATSLLVYYFLPGLYCNVSGIHLIPQRNRRLWVIAAGVYSMMIGTLAFLA